MKTFTEWMKIKEAASDDEKMKRLHDSPAFKKQQDLHRGTNNTRDVLPVADRYQSVRINKKWGKQMLPNDKKAYGPNYFGNHKDG